MLWAPVPFTGDFSEFRQRGILMVIVALYCWNARWAVLLFPALSPRWAALAACLGLAVTVAFVASWKAPRMDWAKTFINTKVPPGLVEASAWLRAHEGPASAFTTAELDPNAALIDDPTILMALSGSSAWLSRPAIILPSGGVRAQALLEREGVLAKVAKATDVQAAMSPLRSARVAFYVVTGQAPVWDPSRAKAVFRNSSVAIYDTGLKSSVR